MRDVRKNLDIDTITSLSGSPKGVAAKCKIADILGFELNSVRKFKEKVGLLVPTF